MQFVISILTAAKFSDKIAETEFGMSKIHCGIFARGYFREEWNALSTFHIPLTLNALPWYGLFHLIYVCVHAELNL